MKEKKEKEKLQEEAEVHEEKRDPENQSEGNPADGADNTDGPAGAEGEGTKDDVAKEDTKKEEEKQPTPEEVIADLTQKLLYLQADYQNYRKRMVKEISDARAYSQLDTLTPFMTIYDYLMMARDAAEKSDNIEAVRQGLKMIIDQFFKAFDELGLKEIETDGKQFDPNIHEAIGRECSDTIPEGVIIRSWNHGFKLGERLMRAAKVVVSSGPRKPDDDKTGENGAGEEEKDEE